jgi:hypothetical protein
MTFTSYPTLCGAVPWLTLRPLRRPAVHFAWDHRRPADNVVIKETEVLNRLVAMPPRPFLLDRFVLKLVRELAEVVGTGRVLHAVGHPPQTGYTRANLLRALK